jgi:organic hydroperoxide reductase OsmC/OhrA
LTHPPEGRARVSVESDAFSAIPVSLPEDDPVLQEATPGELLAVTHGMFVAWALSEVLVNAGTPAEELVIDAACTFAGAVANRELVGVDLRVQGRVPGLNAGAFDEAVDAARGRYLRSLGARDDLPGQVKAVFQPSAKRPLGSSPKWVRPRA